MQELNFIVTMKGKQKLGEATLDNPVQLAGMRLFHGYTEQELAEIETMEDIITDVSESQEIILSPLGGNYDFTAGIMSLEASDNGTDAYQAKTAVIYYEENANKIPFAITTSQQVTFTKLATSALTVSAHLTFQEESEVYIDFAYEIRHPLANIDNAGIVRLATVDDVKAGITAKDNTPLVMQIGQGCSLLSRDGSTSPIFSIKEHSIDNVVNISSIGDMLILDCLRIRDFIYFELDYSSLSGTTNIIENGSPKVSFDKIRSWRPISGSWALKNPTSATPTIFRQSNYGSNDSVIIFSGTGVRGSSLGSTGNQTIVSCRSELTGTFRFEVPLHKVQSGVVMFYALVIGVA